MLIKDDRQGIIEQEGMIEQEGRGDQSGQANGMARENRNVILTLLQTMLDFTADNIPKVLDCGPGANNVRMKVLKGVGTVHRRSRWHRVERALVAGPTFVCLTWKEEESSGGKGGRGERGEQSRAGGGEGRGGEEGRGPGVQIGFNR
eukprot:760149-Hanusia_phi.AAC.1